MPRDTPVHKCVDARKAKGVPTGRAIAGCQLKHQQVFSTGKKKRIRRRS